MNFSVKNSKTIRSVEKISSLFVNSTFLGKLTQVHLSSDVENLLSRRPYYGTM